MKPQSNPDVDRDDRIASDLGPRVDTRAANSTPGIRIDRMGLPRFLLTLAIVFGAEALVMFTLDAIPQLGRRMEDFLDSLLLTVLIAPFIWLLFVRPLRRRATESRHIAEDRIRRLRRVYDILGGIQEAILRIRDPPLLLTEVCRVVVETGGFRMAWVGLLGPEGNLTTVRPIAWAGVIDGYLEKLQIDASDGSLGLGPTGKALSAGKRNACNDIASDPRMAPWRQDALLRGYRSSAAFPLTVSGRTLGAISIYSHEAGFFGDEELNLLDLMAANVSLATEMAQLSGVQQQLMTAIEQSPVSVVITDVEGGIEYVSPAFTQITGYTSGEALGGTPRLLKSGRQGPETYRELWSTIRGGKIWHGDLVNRRKDGSFYTQELTVAPVHNQGGDVTHFVAISQDVSERKQAEETLRSSEARYHSLFDRNLAGVYRTTLDGRVLECNAAFAHIFGYASCGDALSGGTHVLYAVPGDREKFLERIESEGIVTNHAFEGRRKDGSRIWLLENAQLVRGNPQGLEPSIEATLLDITERKLAEDAQANSLREKEALLKEVHHRVKNNLQVITSLLRLERGRSEEPAARQVLMEMQGRIHSMALLHETIYRAGSYSAIDLGSYLGSLATQVVRTLSPGLGTVEIDQQLSPVTVGLDQAIPCGLLLHELLSNCLKHAFPNQAHGTIRLELQPLHDSTVRLRVKDDGVGLAPDFEVRRGRSLGLQLVSDLTRQLKGRLEIESGPGAGFSVTFEVDQVVQRQTLDMGALLRNRGAT